MHHPKNRHPIAVKLGVGHHGFRTPSRVGAAIALAALLLLPALVDIGAFHVRMRDHLPDLKVWLPISESFVGGDRSAEMYPERGWYLYPPIFLILVYPLTFVSEPMAAVVFEAAKWFAVYFALLLTWRMCSRREEDQPPVVALLTIAFAFRYIWNDMGQGNINCFILLAIAAGCRLMQTNRPFWAGAVVAFAACVKVTPAIFLVYFLYRGWWRTLPGAMVCAVLCWVLVPGAVFGFSYNLQVLQDWFALVIESSVRDAAVDSLHTNQSVAGLVNRLFTNVVAIQPETRITLVELNATTLRILRLGIAAAIAAVLALFTRRRTRGEFRPQQFGLEVGLVTCAMLMLSGISWKAHYVVMVLPFAALLSYLADARTPSRRRSLIQLLTLIAGAIPLVSGDLITPEWANVAEAWGVHLIGLLAVFVASAVALRQLSGESAELPEGKMSHEAAKIAYPHHRDMAQQ